MKKILFIVFITTVVFDAKANVNPRYKANLYFGNVVVNGDTLLKNTDNKFEISFFEESSLTELISGVQGTLGVKVLGRPVWRKGTLTHNFVVQLYFRKITTDKWSYLSERELMNWESEVDFKTLNTSQYLTMISNSLGVFKINYVSRIELLKIQYELAVDSNFLPKFTFQVENMRINGKKVKLSKNIHESLNKRKGDFLIGKVSKSPVSIKFEINKGTAKNDNDFEVVIYYLVLNKHTGQLTQQKVISQFISVEKPTFGTSIQTTDSNSELFFINFNLSVSQLYGGKLNF